MSEQTPPRERILIGMALVMALAVLLMFLNERKRRLAFEAIGNEPVTAGAAASIGAPFALLDVAGRRVTDGDLRGRRVLLMFAPIGEGERTPAALQVASAALQGLGDRAAGIAPVLVAIAPAGADEGAAARRAAELLAPLAIAWTGLVGPRDDIARLARAYFVPLPGGETNPAAKGTPPAVAPLAILLDTLGRYIAHTGIPNDPGELTAWIQKKL